MWQRAMAALASGSPAPPLSIHTSAGTPAALGGFLHALSKHLPWDVAADGDADWFASLQVAPHPHHTWLRNDP